MDLVEQVAAAEVSGGLDGDRIPATHGEIEDTGLVLEGGILRFQPSSASCGVANMPGAPMKSVDLGGGACLLKLAGLAIAAQRPGLGRASSVHGRGV